MDDIAIDDQAEQLVRAFAQELTGPRVGECLVCYVARMIDAFGCDTTLRFARSFRDQRAPRATALERRLGNMGGFCDCEIFLNAMVLAPHLRRFDSQGEELPVELPQCARVRRGSTQGCTNWVRKPWGWC
jgi:hypothetical protein